MLAAASEARPINAAINRDGRRPIKTPCNNGSRRWFRCRLGASDGESDYADSGWGR